MAKNIILEFPRDIEKIKPLGRYQALRDAIGCDHCATGIELYAYICGELLLCVDTTEEKEKCDSAYFTVYIDGKRQSERLRAPKGEHILTVAFFETSGEHVIRIVKENESNYNLCAIKWVSFSGEILEAPAKRERYIEYIGDSLSCGMGALGKKGVPDPQTSIWEDVTQGYTYCSAEELCADCSIISESGIGLAGSWYDPLFDFYSAWSYKRNKDIKYDFARIPDLLVINLGTNDFYLNCDLKICPTDEVEQKVKEFIALVRGSYRKDIPIVWVSRFMFLGNSYVETIDKAIETLGGEAAKIYRLDVTPSNGGAHGHPDVAGHAVACRELVDFIKSKKLL